MAAHLGIIDEEQIDNMSYLFFENVMRELGHKLTYDAVANYAGNGFCKDSWEMITKNNPFNIETGEGGENQSTMRALAGFFNSSDIKVKQAE